MTSSKPAIALLMARLRPKYLAQLRERRRMISDFSSGCKRQKLTEALCDATSKEAHSLAGSGTTYGFSDISTTARALEHALQEGERNAGVLAGLARPLLAACDMAASAGSA